MNKLSMEADTPRSEHSETNAEEQAAADLEASLDTPTGPEIREVTEADREEAIRDAAELAEEINELAGDSSAESQGALARIALILKRPVEQLRAFLGHPAPVEKAPLPEATKEELEAAEAKLVKLDRDVSIKDLQQGILELLQKLDLLNVVSGPVLMNLERRGFDLEHAKVDIQILRDVIKEVDPDRTEPGNKPLYDQLNRFLNALEVMTVLEREATPESGHTTEEARRAVPSEVPHDLREQAAQRIFLAKKTEEATPESGYTMEKARKDVPSEVPHDLREQAAQRLFLQKKTEEQRSEFDILKQLDPKLDIRQPKIDPESLKTYKKKAI